MMAISLGLTYHCIRDKIKEMIIFFLVINNKQRSNSSHPARRFTAPSQRSRISIVIDQFRTRELLARFAAGFNGTEDFDSFITVRSQCHLCGREEGESVSNLCGKVELEWDGESTELMEVVQVVVLLSRSASEHFLLPPGSILLQLNHIFHLCIPTPVHPHWQLSLRQ